MNYPLIPPPFADIDTASEDYARRFRGQVGEFFLEVQTKILLELIAPWPRATVLDVGGGHGQIAVPMVQNGYKVTVAGSGPLGPMRLASLLQPNAFTFETCHLLHLPFENRSFDIVASFRLLPHMEEWPELVAEMCRVADKAVIVDYPDSRSFNYFSESLFKAKKAVEGNTRPFRCFTRSELLGHFTKNQFGDPLFQPEFFIPMAIHRGLKSRGFSRAVESFSRAIGLTRLWGSPIILRVLRGNPSETKRNGGP
jgi:2-polyprenyl-3-methyl-5-hydroxy-6-metoxy-1,4-benzoquinol methylase